MAILEKLAGKQLRHLRALAHSIKPIVHLGKQGFTDGVKGQIDQALTDHELIKVKVGSECPDDLKEIAARAAEQLGAHIAQTIGATIVLYRQHPKDPKIQLPRPV